MKYLRGKRKRLAAKPLNAETAGIRTGYLLRQSPEQPNNLFLVGLPEAVVLIT